MSRRHTRVADGVPPAIAGSPQSTSVPRVPVALEDSRALHPGLPTVSPAGGRLPDLQLLGFAQFPSGNPIPRIRSVKRGSPRRGSIAGSTFAHGRKRSLSSNDR